MLDVSSQGHTGSYAFDSGGVSGTVEVDVGDSFVAGAGAAAAASADSAGV